MQCNQLDCTHATVSTELLATGGSAAATVSRVADDARQVDGRSLRRAGRNYHRHHHQGRPQVRSSAHRGLFFT